MTTQQLVIGGLALALVSVLVAELRDEIVAVFREGFASLQDPFLVVRDRAHELLQWLQTYRRREYDKHVNENGNALRLTAGTLLTATLAIGAAVGEYRVLRATFQAMDLAGIEEFLAFVYVGLVMALGASITGLIGLAKGFDLFDRLGTAARRFWLALVIIFMLIAIAFNCLLGLVRDELTSPCSVPQPVPTVDVDGEPAITLATQPWTTSCTAQRVANVMLTGFLALVGLFSGWSLGFALLLAMFVLLFLAIGAVFVGWLLLEILARAPVGLLAFVEAAINLVAALERLIERLFGRLWNRRGPGPGGPPGEADDPPPPARRPVDEPAASRTNGHVPEEEMAGARGDHNWDPFG